MEIWSEDKSFSQVFTGDEGTYYDITSIGGAYYVSPIIHHVRVVDVLSPETVYSYHVGSEDEWSSDFTFTTAPNVGELPSSSDGLVFAVIGDLGQTTDSQQTVSHIELEEDVSMILHAGDLSYADGEQARWDSWGDMIQNLSAVKPWMTCPGNHEIEVCARVLFSRSLSRNETMICV